jgi:hypothetical protein
MGGDIGSLSNTGRTTLLSACLATGVVAGILTDVGAIGRLASPASPDRESSDRPTKAPRPAESQDASSANLDLHQVASLYRRASAADADALTTLFRTVESSFDGVGRLQAMTILYARFAEIDPLAAFDHAMANGVSLSNVWAVGWTDVIFRAWARQDLQSALAYVGDLANPEVAIAAILSVRPDLPPAQQLVIVRRLPYDKAVQELATPDNVTSLADDPASAFHGLDPSMHDARRAAAMAWTLRDPHSALNALFAQPDSTSELLARDMIGVWARSAPQDALAWALTRDAGETRNRYLSAALKGAASDDPEQAATVAAGLADDAARRYAVSSVLSEWAEQDPAAAVSWFESLSEVDTRREAVRAIAHRYGRHDPQGAYTWARSLAPHEADAALPNILFWMVRDGAAETVLEHLKEIVDPKARDFAARLTVSEWAKTDAEAAYRWARERADPALREGMTEAILFSWGMTNRDGLVRMLDGIDDRTEYAQVIQTAWRFLGTEELERAYGRVSDESVKAQIAQLLRRTLGWTDPTRAEALEASTELDDGQP